LARSASIEKSVPNTVRNFQNCL